MDERTLFELIHDCIDKRPEPCSRLYGFIHAITTPTVKRYNSFLTAEDGKDIIQTIDFKLAHNGLKLFKGTSVNEFIEYLRVITVNEIISFLRVKRDLHTYDVIEPATPAFQDDPPQGLPESLSESREIMQVVYDVLKEYRPHEREAFIMYHVKGFTYEEIAGRLEVPVSTLATRFDVIKQRIRDRLAPSPKKLGDTSS